MRETTPGCAVEALPESDQQRLATILDDYLGAIEQGRPIPPEELLRRHPRDAAHLRGYLSGLNLFHQAVEAEELTAAQAGLSGAEPGQQLGDYRLIREVGRGGMGVVYEAEQLSLKRRVALKVLPFVIAGDEKRRQRFQTESQIAASIEHPSIVPVHAIGEERGIHFYAMQFIDGPSLGDWIGGIRDSAETLCVAKGSTRSAEIQTPSSAGRGADDDAPLSDVSTSVRSLDGSELRRHLRSVVGIGVQAAEALHAAHEYGVVHRDVKPSNLLIDEAGKVWITDFGLARCRGGSDLTQTGDMLGTLMYMSPEQVGGEGVVVDYRTDIYSLGITLYEAIVLRNPLATGGPAAAMRARRTHRRLRQWDARIPADLEMIVMKAIAEAPEDRYASMASLAEDLRRFEAGEPILAKPPCVARRVQAWARKRQQAVVSAVFALLVAVVALSITVVFAERERQAAQELLAYNDVQLEESHKTLDSLFRSTEQLAAVPGAERVRRQLLDEILAYYKHLAEESSGKPEFREALALAYSKIGEHGGTVGDKREAVAYIQRSCELLEDLLDESPNHAGLRHRLALNQNNLGTLQRALGQPEEARQNVAAAARILTSLAADSGDVASDLAACRSNLGLIALDQGDTATGKKTLSDAIALLEGATAADANQDDLRQLAIAYSNYASASEGDQSVDALLYYGEAVDLQKRLMAEQPLNLLYQRDLARTYNNLGRLSAARRDWPEATANYQSSMAIQQRLVEVSPRVANYRRDLATSQNNLGMVYARQGKTPKAAPLFEAASQVQRDLLDHNPADVQALMSLGGLENNRGMLLRKAGDAAAALPAFRDAVHHQSRALELAPTSAPIRQLLSNHLLNLADCYRRLGKTIEAEQATARRRELTSNRPALATPMPTASSGAPSGYSS